MSQTAKLVFYGSCSIESFKNEMVEPFAIELHILS